VVRGRRACTNANGSAAFNPDEEGQARPENVTKNLAQKIAGKNRGDHT
jgi:hypothetical protein